MNIREWKFRDVPKRSQDVTEKGAQRERERAIEREEKGGESKISSFDSWDSGKP